MHEVYLHWRACSGLGSAISADRNIMCGAFLIFGVQSQLYVADADMDGLLLNTESFYTVVQDQLCKKYGTEFSWDLKAKVCPFPLQPTTIHRLQQTTSAGLTTSIQPYTLAQTSVRPQTRLQRLRTFAEIELSHILCFQSRSMPPQPKCAKVTGIYTT